jgi:serine/threonine protein kinase
MGRRDEHPSEHHRGSLRDRAPDRLGGDGGRLPGDRPANRGAVALKVLQGGTSEGVERFAREAELLEALQHPGIVRYVAHGTAPSGERFLAMEWLEGESLADRLAREGPAACSSSA